MAKSSVDQVGVRLMRSALVGTVDCTLPEGSAGAQIEVGEEFAIILGKISLNGDP